MRRVGVADLALGIFLALKAALFSPRLVLLVGEFHELPGYNRAGPGEDLEDLRSLLALLSNSDDEMLLVVTVSYGFAATHDALSRLEGYSTRST